MGSRDRAGSTGPVEPEYAVEQWFVGELESAGWKTLKADRLKRGWADTFCFGPGGRTVIVEVKREDAPRRDARRGEKLQAHYRREFKALGFEVHKVYGRKQAEKLLRRLLR